jgi:glycosyltransferase involved in cell wall biosynthesis
VRKRKIIFFSPLPPQRNGIADYTASFLADLAEAFDIVIVVEDGVAPIPIAGVAWIHLSDYLAQEDELADLQHIYQVGNNRDHGYQLPVMQRHPGLTTLHDLSVHHMVDTMVGDATLPAYRELVTESYGARGLALAREVRLRRERPIIFHLELDFLAMVASRSRAIMTHSMLGKLRISAAAELPVYRIPHPYQARAKAYQEDRRAARIRARAELGLPADELILLSLGFVTRAKRIDLSLAAFAHILATGRRVRYVIAGAVNPQEFDLWSEICRLGLQNNVTVTEYVPDARLLDYFAAADVLINLRYPTMGETSGTVTNALGVGCCTIVTAIGSFDEIPDHCVAKVPVAEMTPEGLLRRLLPLIDSPGLRASYEQNALRYARAELSPEQFVERYVEAIDDAFANGAERRVARACDHHLFKPASSRRAVERVAREAEASYGASAQMWWRSLLLPIAEDGLRLLVLGREADKRIAEQAFEWAGRAEADAASRPDGAYDVALVVEDVADFRRSPFALLFAANRALDIDGLLVLNVTGASPEMVNDYFCFPAPPARKKEDTDRILPPLDALLASAGFRIERIVDRFQEVRYAGEDERSLDEDVEFCLQAVKISHKLIADSPLVSRRY